MRVGLIAERVLLALAGVILLLAACASSGGEPIASASAAVEPSKSTAAEPSVDLEHPVGIIAIGHSGLTGEGTGSLYEPVPANSWATGGTRVVNSIYLRMVAVLPETEGHVANTAVGGAPAALLPSQAEQALLRVPVPALAIVSTIDNDITCDGGDTAHVPALGRSVAEALRVIHEASPNTKILVIGQLGRPSPEYVQELVAFDPAAKATVTFDSPCTFYDADGNLNPAGFELLTGIIEVYEAEQARVCSEVPNCQTDGGVRAAWIDRLDFMASDWAHLNLAGQTAEAENLWPVVSELLGM